MKTRELKDRFRFRKLPWQKFFSPTPILKQLFVDGVNGRDSNNGDSDHPIKTIMRAVDMASYGTQILLKPATYEEEVIISKGGIELLGELAQSVIIEPESADYGAVILTGNANRTIVRNVTGKVSGNLMSFAIDEGVEYCTIENCIADAASGRCKTAMHLLSRPPPE